LPSGPVVNDLVPRHGQGVIGINVVEVTEAEQDVVDRLLGILGFEARDEQRQTLVGRPPGPLFDRHQVEVIAQFAAIPDHLELHGQKVAEPGDLQAVDFLRRFKEVLGAAFVGVQELHLGGGEDAVKGSRGALGDGKRAYGIQAAGQLVEVDALMVEEEVQVPANSVTEVDGDGRAAAKVGIWRDDRRDRVPCPRRVRREYLANPVRRHRARSWRGCARAPAARVRVLGLRQRAPTRSPAGSGFPRRDHQDQRT
jgi:hypothetical protein